MNGYKVEDIRNIALISHSGAGKTSLAETMLFLSGGRSRWGRVDEGSSILDHDPEEKERQVSINTAIAPVKWNGCKINLLDTPGYFDFVGEVKVALRAADVALVTVEGVSGVEVGTELVWGYTDELNLPRVVFVNKLDRENADFFKVLGQLREHFDKKLVPLQIPIGKEDNFSGIVDLLSESAFSFDEEGNSEQIAIPDDLAEDVEQYREELLDAVVERDDELLLMYLEGEELDPEALKKVLKEAVVEQDIVPVLCGSAMTATGITAFMDFVVDYLPAPSELPAIGGEDPENNDETTRDPSVEESFSGLAFKTMTDPYVGRLTLTRIYSGRITPGMRILNSVKGESEEIDRIFVPKGDDQEELSEAVAGEIVAIPKLQVSTTGDTLCSLDAPIVYPSIEFPDPVYSVAVRPESRGDEDKLGSGLSRVAEEDPTFHTERNSETNEQIVSGMGEMHVSVMTQRLKRKFGVSLKLSPPKIAYRETIRRASEAHYRHKKQSGGRGQFGEVDIRLEPMERGGGFEFVDDIFGGAVPRQFIPAVEKGIIESMQEGPLAGYPVTDIRATLFDGGYHPVDSSEMAFKIAASRALTQAFMDAAPVLLEPIVQVTVQVPEEFMGDVIGDLNRKRGQILGMEPRGKFQVIKARAPAAEMVRYAIDLRSITQGRGTFTSEFAAYEMVPEQEAEKVIEQAQSEEE